MSVTKLAWASVNKVCVGHFPGASDNFIPILPGDAGYYFLTVDPETEVPGA